MQSMLSQLPIRAEEAAKAPLSSPAPQPLFNALGYSISLQADDRALNEADRALLAQKIELAKRLIPALLIYAKRDFDFLPQKTDLIIEVRAGHGGQYLEEGPQSGRIKVGGLDAATPCAEFISTLCHELAHYLADLPEDGEWLRGELTPQQYQSMLSIIQRFKADPDNPVLKAHYEQIEPIYKRFEANVFRQDVLMEGATQLITIRLLQSLDAGGNLLPLKLSELQADMDGTYETEKAHAGLLMLLSGPSLFFRAFLSGEIGPISASIMSRYSINPKEFDHISQDLEHLVPFLISCDGLAAVRELDARLQIYGVGSSIQGEIDNFLYLEKHILLSRDWSPSEVQSACAEFQQMISAAEKNGKNIFDLIREMGAEKREKFLALGLRIGTEAGIPLDDCSALSAFWDYFHQAMLPSMHILQLNPKPGYSKIQNMQIKFPSDDLDGYADGIRAVAKRYGLKNPYFKNSQVEK